MNDNVTRYVTDGACIWKFEANGGASSRNVGRTIWHPSIYPTIEEILSIEGVYEITAEEGEP